VRRRGLFFLTGEDTAQKRMEFFVISMLNGLSYGLLLFMLSSGLTLIFSMMGVLNFAHASFYMLGAYLGYTVSRFTGFWPALLVAPSGRRAGRAVRAPTPAQGAQVRPRARAAHHLRPVLRDHRAGAAGVGPHRARVPAAGRPAPAFTLVNNSARPACTGARCSRCTAPRSPFRALHDAGGAGDAGAIWLLLTRTRIGLVIQAALTHPDAVEALGHNVPRVFMLVFGGGAALAGLAGVIGGNAFVTEPAMAATVGSVIFVVVVVGGMGSLAGAFLASLLIGVVQTFAVGVDYSLMGAGAAAGRQSGSPLATSSWKLTISQVAPILPYLFLVLILIFRPRACSARGRADAMKGLLRIQAAEHRPLAGVGPVRAAAGRAAGVHQQPGA
jgi:branched-chain amino acid transport system permease protein